MGCSRHRDDYDTTGCTGCDRETIRQEVQQAIEQERAAIIEIAESFLHNCKTQDGDVIDRVGQYSNATVHRIVTAIKARARSQKEG